MSSKLKPLSEVTLEDAAKVYELAFGVGLDEFEGDYYSDDELLMLSLDNDSICIWVDGEHQICLSKRDIEASSDLDDTVGINLPALAYLIRKGYDLGELSQAFGEGKS